MAHTQINSMNIKAKNALSAATFTALLCAYAATASDLSIERPRQPAMKEAGTTKTLTVSTDGKPNANTAEPQGGAEQTTGKVPASASKAGLQVRRGKVAELLSVKSEAPIWWHFNLRQPVYVVDFPSLTEQSRVFSRIVVYIERAEASRTQILDEQQLSGWLKRMKLDERTLTLGNNYRVTDVVSFFNAAKQQSIQLRPEEQWLLDGLIALNLVAIDTQAAYLTKTAAVILSIPQVSEPSSQCPVCAVSEDSRKAIFSHEFAHAVYSSHEALSQQVKWFFYNRMPEQAQKRFVSFLAARGYDVENSEIVINEFFAFFLHTPDRNYFDAAATLNLSDSEIGNYRAELNQKISPMVSPW